MNLAGHIGHRYALLCLAQARGHPLRRIPGPLRGTILPFRKFRSSHKTRVPAGSESREQVAYG